MADGNGSTSAVTPSDRTRAIIGPSDAARRCSGHDGCAFRKLARMSTRIVSAPPSWPVGLRYITRMEGSDIGFGLRAPGFGLALGFAVRATGLGGWARGVGRWPGVRSLKSGT